MLSLRLIGAVVLSLVAGCSWVLPKPSQPPGTEAAATADAACTLELTEARKARSTSLEGLGAAQPLIISLGDGPNTDHMIRAGNAILLRRAPGGGGQAVREQESVQALIVTIATGTATHDRIGDQDVVRLRSRRSPSSEGNKVSDGSGPVPLTDRDSLIFKADTPNPNRPSTCDSMVRDGDFIYLESVSQSTWVGMRNGALVLQDARPIDQPPCRTPMERCYTDRYGGMLCANYFECVAKSGD